MPSLFCNEPGVEWAEQLVTCSAAEQDQVRVRVRARARVRVRVRVRV